MSIKIIAEIGNNHNGNFDLACNMVQAAKKAGANYAKFQIYNVDDFLHKKSEYYGEFVKEELSYQDFAKIYEKFNTESFKIIATPFDAISAKFLLSLGVDIIKIASGDIDNFLMFNEIVNYKPEIIFSTGGASEKEIKSAYNYFKNSGCNKVTPLHCIANYPAENEELNIGYIYRLKEILNCDDVGYSDHSIGIKAPAIAASIGATIIEKHFTIDKNLPGGDNEMSINEAELAKMISNINEILIMKGLFKKDFSINEKRTKNLITRRFYSKKNIEAGEKITSDCLLFLRTDENIDELSIDINYFDIINSVATRNIPSNKLILKTDICQT
tara:strand:- start:32375 stop:33361 length:987 start_codon:yes stop_codon:yes gene_type:complete